MLSLDELGLTKEELTDRVVNRIAEMALSEQSFDEDGEAQTVPSSLHKKLVQLVQRRIDAKIEEVAEAHILPNVAKYVEDVRLQETNKWGERKGATLTFIEYLVQRAEAYLNEQVDYKGKSKGQDSYSWTAKSTRLTYLVHEHLHYTIDSAMKEAVKNVNGVLSGALTKTCEIQLKEIASKLKVDIKTA